MGVEKIAQSTKKIQNGKYPIHAIISKQAFLVTVVHSETGDAPDCMYNTTQAGGSGRI